MTRRKKMELRALDVEDAAEKIIFFEEATGVQAEKAYDR